MIQLVTVTYFNSVMGIIYVNKQLVDLTVACIHATSMRCWYFYNQLDKIKESV